MAVFVHSIVIFCFKFLIVNRLGPTATLKVEVTESRIKICTQELLNDGIFQDEQYEKAQSSLTL